MTRRGVPRRRRLRQSRVRSSGEPDQSAVGHSVSFGADGKLTAGWRGKDPTQILPPQPQLVPLNEVLPNTGIPLITSDLPPWDATAVDRNPP